jgi:NitT/TauT family transport system substrate-binding protein
MQIIQNRRRFLASISAAGAAGVLGARSSLADEGPPEVTTIRPTYWLGQACVAPMSIAAELLRAEGFTDVHFVPPASDAHSVARGEVDFDLDIPALIASQVDAGEPITALAGVHGGCYELFVHEPIRTISNLKGKKVGIDYVGRTSI